MKAILFNIHDFALLLTMGISALFAGAIAAEKPSSVLPSTLSRGLLSCFFILIALVALDKLMFWGEALKYQIFQFSPALLVLFSFAIFGAGPVLYWYIKSRLSPAYFLKPVEYLHLLPALGTPLYLYLVYFQFSPEVQRELLLEQQIYDHPGLYFSYFIHLKKLIPTVYAALSTILVIRHQHLTRTTRTVTSLPEDRFWLISLSGGFTLVWLWALATHLYGLHHPGSLSDAMGIVGNYLTLILIITLMFYKLAYVNTRSRGSDNNTESEEALDPASVERICQLMDTKKPFLNPQLTLERFALLVDLPPRQVSRIINRHFDQNFQEYINRYRIQTARQLLSDAKHENRSIQEVAKLAGFNSKATFHRIFKSIVALTPSEYRQQHQTKNKTRQH